MSDYIPGRIYSGVIRGRRGSFVAANPTTLAAIDGDTGHFDTDVSPTDIRGPLVVLDLTNYGYSEALPRTLRQHGWDPIACQIEAQTTPPLQVGWHECHLDNALPRVLWWDGERFLHAPHGSWVDKWRSVAYLGKGTRA